MIKVISSFADGPVNFNSTGPAEDQIQKLISSTDYISLEISFNTNIIIWLLRIIFPSNKSLTIVWDPTRGSV